MTEAKIARGVHERPEGVLQGVEGGQGIFFPGAQPVRIPRLVGITWEASNVGIG